MMMPMAGAARRGGFFREVRVKGFDSMLARTLVAARNRLVQITTDSPTRSAG